MIYDAIVVGFGPVGATLTNLLTRAGLRVAVVETEGQIYNKPRALSFDHEAMRVFQFCRLAQHIAPHTAPHCGTHYLGMDGAVIKKFDPLPPPFPLGWPPTSTFVQPELERVLREGVMTRPRADILLRHQALAFTQDDECVALTIRDLVGGTHRTVLGRMLLACDGANSTARRALGIELEDLGFDEWWMVVDTHIVRPVQLPPRSIQYCWPSRPATFVPGPGSLRRWEIKLLPGEDPEVFGQHENVVRQIARFVDPACFEIWRSAVYRFHALIAQRWRHGRVFLLGDACHQTPPFLGQGLCAGIRDAANLAWKLSLVLQHGASPTLLDSYALERKPHVRQLVATAKDFGHIIGELDVNAARVRDRTLRDQLQRGEAETIRQRFVPNLQSGIIDQEPGAIEAGALFVQPKVIRCTSHNAQEQEMLLDDLLEFRFLIATATADAQAWLNSASLDLWRRIGGQRIIIAPAGHSGILDACPQPDIYCVAETQTLFADWMQRAACAAVVVRPDRYIFGAGNSPVQLNRMVEALGRELFPA